MSSIYSCKLQSLLYIYNYIYISIYIINYVYIYYNTYLYTFVLYDCGCHIFFQILTRNLPQALPPAGDDEFQCLGKFNPNSQVRGPQGPRAVMFKLCLNRVPYIIYIYIFTSYICMYIYIIYIHHIYIYTHHIYIIYNPQPLEVTVCS